MSFTKLLTDDDRMFVEHLAKGDWQSGLVSGREAWDGSTIGDNELWLKQKIDELGPTNNDVAFHVENRHQWTRNLLSRIREAGYDVLLDGPSALIKPAIIDGEQANAAEAATRGGIADLPLRFHRIELAAIHQGIHVYRVVATSMLAYRPFAVAERFVLGGFTAEELEHPYTVGRLDRILPTLRKAINRAKKTRVALDREIAFHIRERETLFAREEARRNADEIAATLAGIAEDGDAIAAAFMPGEAA